MIKLSVTQKASVIKAHVLAGKVWKERNRQGVRG